MKAVQLRTARRGPEVVDVPVPEPGPGQVLLKVTAVGLCHSDFLLLDMPQGLLRRNSLSLPLTLGHEVVGTVAVLGPGAAGVEVGEHVAVYGAWGCGVCRMCARGEENYCASGPGLGIRPPGLGAPGGMAEYMVVDSPRHLVPIGDLDPVLAAPLTDAGLTPYHAVKRSLPKLVPGSSALVIGVGGLGHLAVRILRATTPARVLALDVNEPKLLLAAEVGAHETVASGDTAARRVRTITGGYGADVVLDFVGTQSTVTLAGECVAVGGDVTIVGVGGGALPVGFRTPALGISVAATYWGTRTDLMEIVELARAGVVTPHVETYGIEDAPKAYELLRHGRVSGRAVVLPHG